MYRLMQLPYNFDDLKPDINEEVVITHYTKHHKSYVDKLNKIFAENNYEIKYSLEEIPKHIEEFYIKDRDDILYNVGGIINHDLYWNSMGKTKMLPSGNLLEKINEKYGDFDNFKNEFIKKAKNLKGSGYTFLVNDLKGELNIINMVNQETPISYNFNPLFTIDLWEHAYYLQYKNNRDKYIENFWNKANFKYANKKYNEFIK